MVPMRFRISIQPGSSQESTGVDDIPAMLTSWENRKELADQWKHQLKEAAAHNQWENPVPAHWEEKSCWFASLDTIAKNDNNLSAGRYKPWKEQETVVTESPAQLLKELADLETDTMKKVQELMEMAGTMSKKKNMYKLESLARLISGRTPEREQKEYYAETGTPWVKIENLDQGYIRETAEYLSEQGKEKVNLATGKQCVIFHRRYSRKSRNRRPGTCHESADRIPDL